MNLAIITISLSLILYIITSFSNLYQKDYPHAFIWFSYSLSQIGFLWYEIQKLGVSK
jgi:hypothetical protein